MRTLDVFDELAEEAKIFPEGTYTGKVVGYEMGYTKSRGTPYTRISVDIHGEKRTVHVFIVCPHTFMSWAMKRLIGQDVPIVLKHRIHSEQIFLEATIKEPDFVSPN